MTADAKGWIRDTIPLILLGYRKQAPIAGKVAILTCFSVRDRKRWDIDNRQKILWDALTHAGVWLDDKQVDQSMTLRMLDGTLSEPETRIWIWEVEPAVKRGLRVFDGLKERPCPHNRHDTHRFIEGEWSLPEFDYLKNNNWVWTEKVDGTNIRVGWDGYAIDFNGRTKDAQTPKFLKSALEDLFTPKASVFKETFDSDDVCLYGEGYGARIQKGGGNYRPDNSFVLFDVLIGGVWLKRESVEDIADKLNLEVVPIVGAGTLLEAIEYAKTPFYSTWGPFHAEGLVCRPEVELKTRMGNRVITKVKTKDWK